MINGVHALIYSTDAVADRAFLRDVLGLRHIDAGEGWLIFALPPAELGVHPTEGSGGHELYLMCEDLESTTAELAAAGAIFARPAQEAGFGRLAMIKLPGGGELGIYQPYHPTTR